MAETFGRDIAAGFAQFLAAAGLGQWDWGGLSPYTADDEWPILIGPEMPSRPDRCIVITPSTPIKSGTTTGNVAVPVQFRIRGVADLPEVPGGSAAQVYRRAQAIADLLQPHGRPMVHVDLGGIPVAAVMPGSELDLNRDDARRPGYVVNVTARARRIIGSAPRPRQLLNRIYLTQAQYDALPEHDLDIVYVITQPLSTD